MVLNTTNKILLNILVENVFLIRGIPNVDNALIYCKTCFKSKIFKKKYINKSYKSILHPKWVIIQIVNIQKTLKCFLFSKSFQLTIKQ